MVKLIRMLARRLRTRRAPSLIRTLFATVIAVLLSANSFGDGIFPFRDAYPVNGIPVAITIADFDNDLHEDLAIISAVGEITIRFGDLSGEFDRSQSVFGSGFRALASGDFDEDGNNDLVVAGGADQDDEFPRGPVVLRGNGAGLFEDPSQLVAFPANWIPTVAIAADFNNDGHLDVAMADELFEGFDATPGVDPGAVAIVLGDGNGSFTRAERIAVGAFPNSIAAGDIDGDSNLDIVVGNQSSLDISILRGNGAGGFLSAETRFLGRNVFSVALGDLNEQGLPDIVAALPGGPSGSDDTRQIAVLLAANNFHSPEYFFSGSLASVSVAVADFDTDGELDVVTANESGNDISILFGDGNGGLGPPQRFPAGGEPFFVAVGDFDGPAGPDLAVANPGSGVVSVLLNDCPPPTPPCPADLDGSGAVDATDLALLLGGWGAPGPADLDGSGDVGAPDLALLLGGWGACP